MVQVVAYKHSKDGKSLPKRIAGTLRTTVTIGRSMIIDLPDGEREHVTTRVVRVLEVVGGPQARVQTQNSIYKLTLKK